MEAEAEVASEVEEGSLEEAEEEALVVGGVAEAAEEGLEGAAGGVEGEEEAEGRKWLMLVCDDVMRG